jgi:hypothetical protein
MALPEFDELVMVAAFLVCGQEQAATGALQGQEQPERTSIWSGLKSHSCDGTRPS